ncbi:hypothetical protein [Amycolatopsis nigrescens]|uniref:hypothetical protein n=1 Tax=Amycolatopsis nigrescens TaxID=381445 RepID=UPI0004766549|nr:hypothetical protein [Amycolatopsis nigrescens]
MDPRDRADALLSRARARGAFVVTPDNATSPMDASNTQQIARAVVAEIDRSQDPDTTAQLPAKLIEENDDHHLASSQPTNRLEQPGAESSGNPVTKPLPVQPPRPVPAAEVREERIDGLIPTTKQTSSGRSNLSRRLDGI